MLYEKVKKYGYAVRGRVSENSPAFLILGFFIFIIFS